MLDVAIFDLDGTLIDTARTSIAAIRDCARRFHFPELADGDVARAIGLPNPEFYYRLYPDLPRADVAAFGARVERREAEITAEIGDSLAFPGIGELLAALHGRGVALYVASMGDRMHVDGALDATGLAKYFDGVYYGDCGKAESLRRILGARTNKDFVMVGDTEIDADAARANGIPCIGAGYGYCYPERHAAFDKVAGSVDHLAGMLMRWRIL